jgi:hypothetical protein
LKNFDENHLAQILFGGAARAMGADELEHEGIKAPDQLARSGLIVLTRRSHKGVGIEFIDHLLQDFATLARMTVARVCGLQLFSESRFSVPA